METQEITDSIVGETSHDEKKKIVRRVYEQYADKDGQINWKGVFQVEPDLKTKLAAETREGMQKLYGIKSLLFKKPNHNSKKSFSKRVQKRKYTRRASPSEPSQVSVEDKESKSNNETLELNYCPHCGFDLNKLAKLTQLAKKLGV